MVKTAGSLDLTTADVIHLADCVGVFQREREREGREPREGGSYRDRGERPERIDRASRQSAPKVDDEHDFPSLS